MLDLWLVIWVEAEYSEYCRVVEICTREEFWSGFMRWASKL